MDRLGGIETVDEEEIGLPRGWYVGIILYGYFRGHGPIDVGLGQLNPSVKHIIRIAVVFLQDRDFAALIMIADVMERVAGTMHGKGLAVHPGCDVTDAVKTGFFPLVVAGGRGGPPSPQREGRADTAPMNRTAQPVTMRMHATVRGMNAVLTTRSKMRRPRIRLFAF